MKTGAFLYSIDGTSREVALVRRGWNDGVYKYSNLFDLYLWGLYYRTRKSRTGSHEQCNVPVRRDLIPEPPPNTTRYN